MKNIFLFNLLLMMSCTTFAQKQTFDVVSFAFPKGWRQQKSEAGIQLSITDKKTGVYGIAVITKARVSSASANENFNNDWDKLVKGAVTVATAPSISDMGIETGWNCITGQADYVDGNNKGLATLITATGYGQTTSVVILTNGSKYQEEILAFVNSLELPKANQIKIGNAVPVATNDAGKSSVLGLWCDNHLETSGYFNGLPQYSAGYFRREYLFKADGTYIFRLKNWSSLLKEILFAYETGTYSVQGNQLIVMPKQGEGGWWAKVGQQASAWGKRIKASDYKLEKTTYTFEIKYYSGSGGYSLIINTNKNTERDGTLGRDGFSYSKFETGKSIIDNPPGFKTGFEDKLFTASTSLQKSSTTTNNIVNTPLAGKIWEATSLEKYGAAYGNTSGFYTGGFWKYQYQFNADGTYHFVYNAASGIASNPVNVLQYETGNYTVTGNQLTITPLKGADEEWSVGKINNGMSAEHIRQVLETRIKRLKITARKLEKVSYPFSVEYWQGNNANALCLKHTQNTVREGSPGQNEQSCFFETSTSKAEKFNELFK